MAGTVAVPAAAVAEAPRLGAVGTAGMAGTVVAGAAEMAEVTATIGAMAADHGLSPSCAR
jgi:hypothetical protein